jgi:ferric-dicitrate binding protein FerR (iron transport regulator)
MGGPTVVVLGTSFNIKSGEDRTEVVVNSGKVSFSKVDPRLNKVRKHMLLKDEALTFDVKSNQIKAPTYIDPATLFYATKTLVFKKTKMKDLVKVLSSVYNQNIEVSCGSLAEEPYNGRFVDASFEEVIKVISATMDADFEKSEEKFIFTNESCK